MELSGGHDNPICNILNKGLQAEINKKVHEILARI